MRFLAVVSLALSCVLGVIVSPLQAQEKRFALVIGNQGYKPAVGGLDNPHNDISIVGNALTQVGFTLLPPRQDPNRQQMLLAVHQLAEELGRAGRGAISFLYYSGHGVAVGRENFLIPVDTDDTSDVTLRVNGVRLSEILDSMKDAAPDAAHFVVLDACRNIRGQRGYRGFVAVKDNWVNGVIM